MSGTGPDPTGKKSRCPGALRCHSRSMAVWNLLAIVAWYIVAGCFSDELNSWYQDDNHTIAVNGIQGYVGLTPMTCSLTDVHFKFETSELVVVVSAMDGPQCVDESEVIAVSNSSWDSGSCRNSWYGWNVLYMYISRFASQTIKDYDTLALMMVLSMLVAMNTGLVAIAVLGGHVTFAVSLNLLLLLYFCFKYLQKHKYAWKQETRLQKRQSRLSQHVTACKLRVLIFAMFGNSWAMDAGMVSQIAELARAATMAATVASSVAEKVGVESMSSGMESASKVLKNPDVFNGEDPTSFMSWKLTLRHGWHLEMIDLEIF